MLFSKFKIGLVSFIFIHAVAYGYDDQLCFESRYSTSISHKVFPLGLAQNKLTINKDGCLITVEQVRYKFLSKFWEIDICRTPVHIKKGKGSIEVLKRKAICGVTPIPEDAFCNDYSVISEVIQDDGLIFAEGDRENFQDPHGQVYCSFLLLQAYLGHGMVFSRHEQYNNTLNHMQKAVPAEVAPAVIPDNSNEATVPANPGPATNNPPASPKAAGGENKSGSF